MQKYWYRNPRIQTDIPLTLVAGETVLQGRCISISVEGMAASLPDVPAIGTPVAVTLHVPPCPVVCRARVTRLDPVSVGFVFEFQAEDDRQSLSDLVNLLLRSSAHESL